jgi:Kef-type K+ transport system membrane component KefB
MSEFLQLTIAVVVLIAAAKVGGYLSYKSGQPAVMGELLAGLILGPTVIDFIHLPQFTNQHMGEMIEYLAEFGVLLLMFIAGLDLHLKDLKQSGKVSMSAGVLGFITPIVMGLGLALLFSYEMRSAVFIGLILSATSVSISAQTLMELGVLRSRVGISLLGAAVVDDILVVLGLSIFVALVISGSTNGVVDIGIIVLRMSLYLGLAIFLGLRLLPRLSQRADKLPVSQGLISFVFIMLLFYAWSAEVLGTMAAITGSFLAGLSFAGSPLRNRIRDGISSIAYGVFIPIFFVNIGLSSNLSALSADLWLMLAAIVAVAIVSKVLGAGLGGRLGGLTNGEALNLGVGMISRGEVGLIVASTGIAEGVIGVEIFSLSVGMVLITTLATPPLLRAVVTRHKAPAVRDQQTD